MAALIEAGRGWPRLAALADAHCARSTQRRSPRRRKIPGGEPGSLVGTFPCCHDTSAATVMRRLSSWMSPWRREELRTNLWLVPSLEVLLAVALFAGTYALDRAAYNHDFTLPSFVIEGSADGARQLLTTVAAAVITVVGVVFSIMIVALTLASTQFGPRMLRNFIRDRGTQHTLGIFVATFVYAILALVSIGGGAHGIFVPHISITLTLLALVLDMGVLIYFINHITTSIQLPQVIASIARDLAGAIAAEGVRGEEARGAETGPSLAEIERQMAQSGGVVRTAHSGYLQFVHYATLAAIASDADAVIRLHYRPGHFLVEATRWPRSGRRRQPTGSRGASNAGTSPGPTARSRRTSPSQSTSSSRSRSARSLAPSTTPSRRSRASTGSARACARSRPSGRRRRSTATSAARFASSPPRSAISGSSSGPTRRSARPAAACRP